MKRIILVSLVVVVAVSPLASMSAPPRKPDATRDPFADLSYSVVLLRDEDTLTTVVDGEQFEIWLRSADGRLFPSPRTTTGTGFVLNGARSPYLVTAAHVAKAMGPTSTVTLMTLDGDPTVISLADFAGQDSLQWLTSSEADVAILRLTPQDDATSGRITSRALPISCLRTDRSSILRSIPLTVIGYPGVLVVEEPFSPICRTSTAASNLVVLRGGGNRERSTFFILDDPSIAGLSGAPVFDTGQPYSAKDIGIVLANRPITVVGLIHGTILDDTGGKLATVVPAFFIAAEIDKLERSSDNEEP